jgi:hypothetical protein
MFRGFLNWLEEHGRKRVVLDRQGAEPYLERYYLFIKDRENFPFNFFLHKFLKSDPDDLHDHPWGYATLILKGGYWEWVPIVGFNIITGKDEILGERRAWRGPGHFRVCKAESFHRIQLDPTVKECWTLFMPGLKKRNWGFLTHNRWRNQKWVDHETYLNNMAN